jgi:hypothetical protein
MRGAIASSSRGGSIDPPAVRPFSLRPMSNPAPGCQISNRDTLRLETPITQTKQTVRYHSNRDKNTVFRAVFSPRRPTAPDTRKFLIDTLTIRNRCNAYKRMTGAG